MGRTTMVREDHSLIEHAFNHKWDGMRETKLEGDRSPQKGLVMKVL